MAEEKEAPVVPEQANGAEGHQAAGTEQVQQAVAPDEIPDPKTIRIVQPMDSDFLITDWTTDPGADPADFGYYDAETGNRFTNFTMPLVREEQKVNGETETFYSFTIRLLREEIDMRISVGDFTNDSRLATAIEHVCGARTRIYCKPKVLREAIREHMAVVKYARQRVSADFGWDRDRIAYRFPSGSVTRDGYRPLGEHDVRIELPPTRFTQRLDLKPPPENLIEAKQHIWNDLIGLHDRRVTLPLLGAAGAAVLFPFVQNHNRFLVALAGKSGNGKTFLSQLFLNLFGSFPVGKGFVPTWNSTTASLQDLGYLFKDVIYLIDDFKRELIDSTEDVVALIQNFADNTARGRLKGGGKMAATRPIRGLLVSTGETILEQSVSSLARTIVVRVPERPADLERGKRCLDRCKDYSGVTSAFIHHLLVTGRAEQFANQVEFWHEEYLDGVATATNALRVASNVGILAAALDEWAHFLKDAVPEANDGIASFLQNDLPVLRDEVLGLIRGAGVQPTYLEMLNDLVREERSDGKGFVYIGDRLVGRRLNNPEVIAISIPWSMEEVNKAMTNRGWQTFEWTHSQLMERLRDDGVLCDDDGRVIPPEAHAEGKIVWIEKRQSRCFRIRSESLRLA